MLLHVCVLVFHLHLHLHVTMTPMLTAMAAIMPMHPAHVPVAHVSVTHVSVAHSAGIAVLSKNKRSEAQNS